MLSEENKLSKELIKQLRIFIAYSLIVFVFSLFIAFLVLYFEKFYPDPFRIESLSSVGGLLQGTLGIAVSLAGAYVAIKISGLSYGLLQKEEKREDYILLNDIINSTIPPIFRVMQEIQKLIDIYDHIAIEHINPLIREPLEKAFKTSDPNVYLRILPHDDEVRVETNKEEKTIPLDCSFLKEFAEQLTSLRIALEEIRLNQYSYYLFTELSKEFAKEGKSLLFKNKKYLPEKYFSSGREGMFNSNSFNDLIFYLKSFEKLLIKKIEKPLFNDLYMPFLSLIVTTDINLNKFFKNGKLHFRNISPAQTIMSMGLIICQRSWWNNEPEDKDVKFVEDYNFEYFNLGGVILVDLVNILRQGYGTYEKILRELSSGVDLDKLSERSPFFKMLGAEPNKEVSYAKSDKSSSADNANLFFNSFLSKGVKEIVEKDYKFKFELKGDRKPMPEGM